MDVYVSVCVYSDIYSDVVLVENVSCYLVSLVIAQDLQASIMNCISQHA